MVGRQVFVCIDAVGIRGHGGAAVLCELLHWLPKVRPDWQWHVFLLNRRFREFDFPDLPEAVTVEETDHGDSAVGRVIWSSYHLPKTVRRIGADVTFAFANIGSTTLPCPQVVFCQQSQLFFPEGCRTQPWMKRLRLRCMRRQFFRAARRSQSVIVQTDAMKQAIERGDESLRGRVAVIPSGVRTPNRSPEIRSHVQKAVQDAVRPRLVYISHPWNHKNHNALIQAMALVIRRQPSSRLMLTLEPHDYPTREYGKVAMRLQDLADDVGVSNNICWLGILNSDEISFVLNHVDAMVFPSLAESFGLGLAEAMAAGCPIAAADMEYAHDVCGDAAIYFDPNDPGNMAEVISELLANKETQDRLREKGEKRKDRFSYPRIATEIASVLEQAVEDASGTKGRRGSC